MGFQRPNHPLGPQRQSISASHVINRKFNSHPFSMWSSTSLRGHRSSVNQSKMSLFRKATIYQELPTTPDTQLSLLDVDRQPKIDSQASQQPSQSPSKRSLGKSYRGWRGGCLLATITTAIVLIINLTFTMWGVIRTKSGLEIATLLVAECNSVNNASKVLHYGINALGKLLVAASNYSMQCLSSPARKEIDVAYSQGCHLNIGVVSLRHWFGWKKKVLFTLLLCSTLSLHFL